MNNKEKSTKDNARREVMRVADLKKENKNLSEKLHKMSLEVKKLKSDLKSGNDS